MMHRLKITLGSHGFSVNILEASARQAVLDFAANLADVETVYDAKTKTKHRRVKDVYATSDAGYTSFGFLLADLEPFKQHLKERGISEQKLQIIPYTPYEAPKIDIRRKEGVGPRDEEQESVMDFLTKPDWSQRVLNLRTGGGKTACGLMASAHWGERVAFVMAATHIKTWFKSDWVLDVSFKKEAVQINGQSELLAAIDLATHKQFNYKLVFISTNTLQDYIKNYLQTGELLGGIHPSKLFEHLGIGMKVVDESHERFKALVHTTIHLNVNKIIYLSATLNTDNRKQQEQYAKIFPKEDTFLNGRKNDHIIAVSSHFSARDISKLRFMGPRGYSHNTFEGSILKRAQTKQAYYELIYGELEEFYFKDYQAGMKALIFVGQIKMAEDLTKWLEAKFKADGRDLTTGAFYAGVNEDKILYGKDVVVSTPGSAGTGRDIENLSVAISTVAISSIQRNLQMLGRPRPLKNYNFIPPYYVWFVCDQIPKHREYDAKKQHDYRPNVKEVRIRHTNRVV